MSITPQIVRERAFFARISIHALMRKAGIANSTFYRWEKGDTTPERLTLAKIVDALEEAEAARKEKVG